MPWRYDASLALQPRNLQARVNRGQIFLATGERDKARDDDDRLAELVEAAKAAQRATG